MNCPDGTEYIGDWKNNLVEGRSTMKFPDGREYIGDWKNNKQHGEGVLGDKNGNPLYAGNWVDDKEAPE